MGENAIVVVEQKSDAGRRQFLPFQQLLGDIQQQVPGNHAALALLQRRLNGVALLARRKKHIRSGQPAAVAATGVLVPRPLPRIVVGRSWQLSHQFQSVRQKQPARLLATRFRSRDNDQAKGSPSRRLEPRTGLASRAFESVQLEEGAVLVARVQAEQLGIVFQHGRKQFN
jgi:hypothetical protein